MDQSIVSGDSGLGTGWKLLSLTIRGDACVYELTIRECDLRKDWHGLFDDKIAFEAFSRRRLGPCVG